LITYLDGNELFFENISFRFQIVDDSHVLNTSGFGAWQFCLNICSTVFLIKESRVIGSDWRSMVQVILDFVTLNPIFDNIVCLKFYYQDFEFIQNTPAGSMDEHHM
jgi:hypothetical protein